MTEQQATLNAITAAIVTVPNIVSSQEVERSCDEFVHASGAAYGAGRRHAANLIGFLGTQWITMAHDEKGEAGNAMRKQRDLMYTKLRALPIPHSNPSVKWKQIKDHAQNILAEQAKAERIAAGEAEPETDEDNGGAKKTTRSTQLRMIEDLTGLYKLCKREEKKLTEQQRKASLHISAALADLGVDLTTM